MRWLSIDKLLDSDYTVIRTDDHPQPRIIKATTQHGWVTLEKFNTKAERDRAVLQLLEDEYIILDE